jgi:hypothetical protein
MPEEAYVNPDGGPDPTRITTRADLAAALAALRRHAAPPGRVRLSVRDLAAQVHLAPSTLHPYLRGDRMFPQDVYERVLHHLGVAPDRMRAWLTAWDRIADVHETTATIPPLAVDPTSAPHTVGVIPPRADAFQHRSVAVVLDQAAAHGGTTVVTQVLAGLGGVGKTQLAADFARRHTACGDLDIIIWVHARSRDAVTSAYAHAAADLGLFPGGEPADRAIARLLSYLANTARRWLVVLDDLADPGDVHDLWPPHNIVGRTVVTTRRRDAGLLAGRNLVEVDAFSDGEAHDYLIHKIPTALADDIDGIVTDLGALPLALGQAAAYLIDLQLTCTDYRTRFADRNRRLPDLFPDPAALPDDNARTVATTWALSIDAANRMRPRGLARPLLELAAALDPNGIPDAVFATDAARDYLSRHGAGRPDAATIHDGLRALHRFHLVTCDSELVRVHALVQRAVREDLGTDDALASAEAAADALMQAWPALDGDSGPLLRANAMALQDNWRDAIWKPDRGMHPLITRTITSLGEAAQLGEAIRLCRHLGDLAEQLLGTDHADSIALRIQLGNWLGDAGSATEAVACVRAVVDHLTTVRGPDDPTTLTARHNLGYQLGQAGHPLAAVAELEAVVTARTRLPDRYTVETLRARNHLAYWRGKSGDIGTAITDLEILLPDVIAAWGPQHRETLDIRAQLWRWRADAGDPATAAVEYERLIADASGLLGAGHRDVSLYRYGLAVFHGRAGQPGRAADTLETLLTERIRMFGDHHRDTIAVRLALSEFRAELGDATAAETHLVSALAGTAMRLGDEHPDVIGLRDRLTLLRSASRLSA